MTTGADIAALSIDLRVADERWLVLGEVEQFAAHVLGLAARRMQAGGEVAMLLTDNAEMHALNKQWRGFDKPTDVLSFPSDAPGEPGQPDPLGDIAIGYETALADAEAMRRPFEAHAAHLMVHGFLHLLGYDHIETEDANVMEPLETEILADLGWPDPYASGPYAPGPHTTAAEEG